MNARGFTLIEFAVVVVCIGVLAGLLLERMLPLVGLAERTAFAQVRGQLSSALLLEAAERVARGESATLAGLDGSNPMELLLAPPANYVGSRYGVSHADMPTRAWYFDERDGVLFYRPGSRTRVLPAAGSGEPVALAVRFAFRDGNGDGRFDPAFDRFGGLALEPRAGTTSPD